jgi:hypothetical protein
MSDALEEGRWYRYSQNLVFEFNRSIIVLGSNLCRVILSQRISDYQPKWIFVIPRLPKD